MARTFVSRASMKMAQRPNVNCPILRVPGRTHRWGMRMARPQFESQWNQKRKIEYKGEKLSNIAKLFIEPRSHECDVHAAV
jgi:hypothetical protein